MIKTDAWVLRMGGNTQEPGKLELESFELPPLAADEVLVDPLFGCWEPNMTHALERLPVDVCRQRREERVVLGNAGTVRVVEVGADVADLQPGDICTLVPIGTCDRFGNTIGVFGFDEPNTVGMLAKRTKTKWWQLMKVPENTRYSLPQWTAFSLKYATAWVNWRAAYGALRLHLSEVELPTPWVVAWGGGVGFALVTLAQRFGCRTAMVASTDERLAQLEQHGVIPLDRREFPALHYDEQRYTSERGFRAAYLRSEGTFLRKIRALTRGEGVSIFMDNIGQPVFRATLRALGPCGVVSTCGWKAGMNLDFRRAHSCIARHTFIHTHGGRREHASASASFAEQTGWLPPCDENIWGWEQIGELAEQYQRGAVDTYFPIFRVN